MLEPTVFSNFRFPQSEWGCLTCLCVCVGVPVYMLHRGKYSVVLLLQRRGVPVLHHLPVSRAQHGSVSGNWGFVPFQVQLLNG